VNAEPVPGRTAGAYAVAILGSFVILAGLAWAIHHYTQPALLGEDRALVRAKALAELRAAETEALEHTGWVDPVKGIVRLRIEDAMKMVERDWGQNASAARSNLIARVEKIAQGAALMTETSMRMQIINGDANLLGTMESAGYDAVVNAIIAASPRVYDTSNYYDTPSYIGYHDISGSDFSSDGSVIWFGAQAFTG